MLSLYTTPDKKRKRKQEQEQAEQGKVIKRPRRRSLNWCPHFPLCDLLFAFGRPLRLQLLLLLLLLEVEEGEEVRPRDK